MGCECCVFPKGTVESGLVCSLFVKPLFQILNIVIVLFSGDMELCRSEQLIDVLQHSLSSGSTSSCDASLV